ncbi:MAG TPA: sulfurtransferase, partial [Roseiarcus sp.]
MSDPVVSTDWLSARLEDPNVVVIDGSWHMPAAGRDAGREYLAGHIPGAVFFGIDEICDHASSLPHMLAAPADFAVAARRLGVNRNAHV